MGISDMGDFQYESLLDSSLLAGLEAQGSSFDEMYPFGIPEGDSTEAPQADATFDFDGFDIEQQATQGVDSGYTLPTTPLSSFPDQRYVPFPTQSQTHPGSVWLPIGLPTQQFHYPNPEDLSQPQMTSTPYYPLQPLPSANTMTPHNFSAMTPPGQQFSSLDRPLFVHGNLGAPAAEAGMFQYEPIQTYQDDGIFNPEDLALTPDDLVATAIREGWALSQENNTQQDPCLDDLFIPDVGNDNDFDASDADEEYKPSSSSSRAKRSNRRSNNRVSKPSRSQATLPNGEVKKGRPCAKPQTDERRRVNQRRMEGYYRRKHDQGSLEKARMQSRESYWRRKQRRIEAGETVRSYNPGRGRSNK